MDFLSSLFGSGGSSSSSATQTSPVVPSLNPSGSGFTIAVQPVFSNTKFGNISGGNRAGYNIKASGGGSGITTHGNYSISPGASNNPIGIGSTTINLNEYNISKTIATETAGGSITGGGLSAGSAATPSSLGTLLGLDWKSGLVVLGALLAFYWFFMRK
jgi:hypothetical protein